MKLKFYVYGGGDESVGIWPTDAVITVEDNFGDVEREESVKQWKELLRSYYDLPEKFCRYYEGIWTQEEYDKMIEAEKEMEVVYDKPSGSASRNKRVAKRKRV